MEHLLQQTLNLYSESWKKDHEEVMRKYAQADGLCEAIEFGTFLFDRMIDNLKSGMTDTCEGVAVAQSNFQAWYQTCSEVISAIEASEREEYAVELADELRSRHREAGAILEELQDAARAITAIDEGRGMSKAGFLNELRSRIYG